MEKQKKSEIIKEFGIHDDDTGSPEVQIALLTERIGELSKHLSQNQKDSSSKRGLLRVVGRRASMLKYLRGKDEERYKSVVTELGLRG